MELRVIREMSRQGAGEMKECGERREKQRNKLESQLVSVRT